MRTAAFLVESFTVEQFPLLLAHWTREYQENRQRNLQDPRYRPKPNAASPEQMAKDKIERVVERLNKYGPDGTLSNAAYKELNDYASRLVDYSYFGVIRNISPESMDKVRQNWAAYNDLDEFHTSTLVHVEGKLKKAEAAVSKYKDDPIWQEFLKSVIAKMKEFLPIAQGVVALKSRIVKRQPKEKETAETLKAKYVAPMASKEAGKIIVDALSELGEKMRVAYEKDLFERFMARAKEFAVLEAQQQSDSRNKYADLLSFHEVWDRTPEYVTVKNFRGKEEKVRWYHHKMSTNASDILQKIAAQAAQDMKDQFVVKNAKKLDSIVDRKSHKSTLTGPPTPVKNLKVEQGALTGEMEFKFDDKSTFVVRNKVVYGTRWNAGYGRSNNFIHYVQFPTTFHDVKLPDGSAMGQPSEERMNNVFATA